MLTDDHGSDKLRKDPRVTQVQVGQLACKQTIFSIGNHPDAVPHPAASAMMSPFMALTLDNDLRDVMLIVGRFGVHRLPVVEQGGLVNLITQVGCCPALQVPVPGPAHPHGFRAPWWTFL